MASIITVEERRRRRALRRTRPSFGRNLGEWLPFGTRVWLHVAIVVMVGVGALLGGRFLHSASRVAVQAAVEPGTGVQPTATAELAIAAILRSPTPAVVTQSEAQPPRETPQVLAMALSLPVSLEDGVVPVRPMASARGGFRDLLPTPTPAPTPTAAPSPTSEPTSTPLPRKEALKAQIYKVVAGDTLIGIAAKFGITPETVLWANDLGNGELLQIGQELTILPVSGVLHKVSKGETFNAIAEAYTADPKKIIEANQLDNADQLQEGQILVVPGGMMRTVSVAGLPTAPSQQELAAAPKYTVKPGDTLLSIADAYGVRASVIQVANELLDPDMLKIGQVLSIPGGRQASAAKPQAPAPKPAPAPRPAPAPAPAPAPEPPPPSGNTGERIAAISQKYLGYRYVWGGTSPSGFDCSGFAWYVYKQAGVGIARAPLESQLGGGPRIGRENLLPGDLVFFQNTYKRGLSHVGIYLGGGRWINAEDESSGVQIRSLSDPFWAARYVGASRPW